jgi:hypothetical protein
VISVKARLTRRITLVRIGDGDAVLRLEGGGGNAQVVLGADALRNVTDGAADEAKLSPTSQWASDSSIGNSLPVACAMPSVSNALPVTRDAPPAENPVHAPQMCLPVPMRNDQRQRDGPVPVPRL